MCRLCKYQLPLKQSRCSDKDRVDEFFDTFPSFQLFHRPTFWDKLQQSQSRNELNALLAAILVFAFKDEEASHDPLDSTKNLSQHFGNLAEQFAEQAMREYAEQGVPLLLLQSMILINHWLLIRSVRGKSWRYLGVCIRCAYELNLHAVDKGKQPHDQIGDVEQWHEDEERRRAWWAIWEMDVFASVVRRCPTGIDWSYNETFLPAPDKDWFGNQPQESCYLTPSIVDRWKKLKGSGNKSHKAWFLVVNSIVKDASNDCNPAQMQLEQARRAREAREGYNKISALHNVLQCIVEMMPAELRYQNQFLNFSPRDSESPATTTRLLHQEIYSMHMAVQYAKLMIYKYFIFQSQMSWPHLEAELARFNDHAESGLAPQRQFGSNAPNNAARQCFVLYLQASQNVVNIIQRTQTNHYKFVNPFLANTIWLATAVQILKRELLQTDTSDRELTASNAELLRMTYLQFEGYWGISNMLERNLSALEVEL
ncbi:fungal-specific transcription factor domain-containing protein, partial [Exophiala viscosa]|uniref:fungal-specific transcription factor domain-containing protein n=1 Tax=Exophiala viscosa TaxID=2486360 RepID=UPI00219D0223